MELNSLSGLQWRKKYWGITDWVDIYRKRQADTIVQAIKYFIKQHIPSYDEKSLLLIEFEYAILMRLNHPNVVVAYSKGTDTISRNGQPTDEAYYIVLEYLPGLNLRKLLKRGRLHEGLARYVYRTLLRTLNYIHGQGLAHLDIKLDNVMITADGTIKLIDFAFAQPLGGPSGDGQTVIPAGTQGYMAPEIEKQQRGPIFAADIFALGVLLFTLLSCFRPFETAKDTDPGYKLIAAEKYERFWRAMLNSGEVTGISLACQHLLNGMWSLNPSMRLTLAEVIQHDWVVHGPICTDAEALAQLIHAVSLP